MKGNRGEKPLMLTFLIRRKNNIWRMIFAFLIAALRFVGIWQAPGFGARVMGTRWMRRIGMYLTRRMLKIDVMHGEPGSMHPKGG